MRNSSSHRLSRNPRSRRRPHLGAVAVEFAIVAPLLFMFFFAAFEFCRVSMIRHTVDNAVYESARKGIVPGSTVGEIRTEATRIMSTIGLTDFDLNVVPGAINDETEEITVTISLPLDVNTFVPAKHFIGETITRQLTMRREGRRTNRPPS